MDTPWRLSGTSRSCTAPGRLSTETARLVQSWPVTPAGVARSVWLTMTKRVRLCASSCTAFCTTCRPYCVAARSLASAATAGLAAASRAPSALLETATRSASGRFWLNQPWHWARACGCAQTWVMPARSGVTRSRLWVTSRLVSPMMVSGDCKSRSSERATTPSVEFSMGSTPKSAEPETVARQTSSMLGQGSGSVGGAGAVGGGVLRAGGGGGAGGPEEGHALARPARPAGGHDLAPDGRDAVGRHRAGVAGLDAVDDLGLAVRAEDGRAIDLLDLAHGLGQPGTLVQQRQQLLVDRAAVGLEVPGCGVRGVSHGSLRSASCSRPGPARRPWAWRCTGTRACRPRTCGP